MTRQVNLIAGEPQEFYEVADFFRLLSAVGPLTVEFYNQGREVSEAVGISKGYAEKFDAGTFDRVRLLSATTQAVQFVTRLGNVVQYDAAPVGDTNIVNTLGTVVQGVATVTSASAQLLAANTARKLLLIQNKSASGAIFVRLDGAAATLANGLRIGPGDSLSLENYVPTGAIFAIGDIASNAEILTIEGQA